MDGGLSGLTVSHDARPCSRTLQVLSNVIFAADREGSHYSIVIPQASPILGNSRAALNHITCRNSANAHRAVYARGTIISIGQRNKLRCRKVNHSGLLSTQYISWPCIRSSRNNCFFSSKAQQRKKVRIETYVLTHYHI